jgi:hypothetical protein
MWWDDRGHRRIPIDQDPGSSLPIVILLIILITWLYITINFTHVSHHVNHHVSQKPQPFLATDSPAGFYYNGTPTTAFAGYYCIESMNSSNGYSIQLSALLNNGVWVVNRYLKAPNGQTGFYINYLGAWPRTPKFVPATAWCAWLVLAIKDGYVYAGYSLNGRSIIWYDSIFMNVTYIEPSWSSGIVLAGYGNFSKARLGRGTLVYLALYYWNGTNWVPAPVGIANFATASETVNHAWVFTSGSCGGYVAWFGWNETNQWSPVLPPNLEPVCPGPPSFKP